MQKRRKALLGVLAAFTALAFLSCEMKLDDEENRTALADSTNNNNSNNTDSSVLYVGLGGENTFNISSVKLGDTEQTITNATLNPSAWNAITEFETVAVPKGSSVSYTFTQAAAGEGAWNTWAIAVYDNATVASANGTFLRGDNWLNSSTDAGFAAGLWSAGGESANGTYSNDFTYETAGKALTSSNTVVITVAYSDSTVTITETVDGTLAYTTSGTITASSSSETEETDTDTSFGWTGSVTGGSWWTVFAGDDVQVPSGETRTTTMTITATGGTNWTCAPDVILRTADATEYGVLRADNYGWGTSVGDACANITATSDWDWDTFTTFIEGSTCTITVVNSGDGTAAVKYDFAKDGTTHYQYYTGIAVDAADLYVNLTFENCSATFVK